MRPIDLVTGIAVAALILAVFALVIPILLHL
jgi:hypothetical protein